MTRRWSLSILAFLLVTSTSSAAVPVAIQQFHFPSAGAVRARHDGDGLVIGSTVASWKDRSGNAHHWAAENANPTVVTGANGRPAVGFISAAPFAAFSASSMAAGSVAEVWFVIKGDTPDITSLDLGPWHFGTTAAPLVDVLFYSVDSKTYDSTGSDTRISFLSGVDMGAWHVIRVVVNGTSREWFIDGVSKATSSAGTQAWPATFELGANQSNYFRGKIHGDLVTSRLLTAGEATAVLAWYRQHYGTP